MTKKNNQDLSVSEMLNMSTRLWEKNKESWAPMEPEHGKTFILYMIEEIGEVISIVKRKKTRELMERGATRDHLIEELADVMMYFSDVLNRFDITPEEFAQVYREKHRTNLGRDFDSEHEQS